jgi:hypothetical protein
VAFSDIVTEFRVSLRLSSGSNDYKRYGHESSEINKHHNYLVAIAGLFVQNSGCITAKEQAVLFTSKMLRLCYAYANGKGMFGDHGTYTHHVPLDGVPWARYMLVSYSTFSSTSR